MTLETHTLIRGSFAKVAPIVPQAAGLFYGRLFALDPSLKPLFKGGMAEQGRKPMAVLATVAANAHRLETLLPNVRELGRRHVGHGVRAAHYDTVGAALLWTLAQGLGEAFRPSVEAAWAEAYATLATVMRAAAAEIETPVAA